MGYSKTRNRLKQTSRTCKKVEMKNMCHSKTETTDQKPMTLCIYIYIYLFILYIYIYIIYIHIIVYILDIIINIKNY